MYNKKITWYTVWNSSHCSTLHTSLKQFFSSSQKLKETNSNSSSRIL